MPVPLLVVGSSWAHGIDHFVGDRAGSASRIPNRWRAVSGQVSHFMFFLNALDTAAAKLRLFYIRFTSSSSRRPAGGCAARWRSPLAFSEV
jgi:hypothetical protein